MSNTIVASDLRKRYGDVNAVDGVSLTVEDGEFFGILGPNGAGKTTTLRMILGLLAPTRGSARVLGHDSAALPPEVPGTLRQETYIRVYIPVAQPGGRK